MQIFGKDLLRDIKNAELLGENAHKIYSPPYRPVFSYEDILTRNQNWQLSIFYFILKIMNGIFLLIASEASMKMIDIVDRSHYLAEKKRPVLLTAKRETSKELGIDEHYVRIIREMSPIYIPPSNFYVHSFVSYTKKNQNSFTGKQKLLN